MLSGAVADGRVVRVAAGPGGAASAAVRLEQWRGVVTGDPRADRVVVTDERGCHAVLAGTTEEQLWRSCDWEPSVFSSDGRYAAGRSTKYGGLGVIDITTRSLVLAIDPESNPAGPRMMFDGADRLNLPGRRRPGVLRVHGVRPVGRLLADRPRRALEVVLPDRS